MRVVSGARTVVSSSLYHVVWYELMLRKGERCVIDVVTFNRLPVESNTYYTMIYICVCDLLIDLEYQIGTLNLWTYYSKYIYIALIGNTDFPKIRYVTLMNMRN